MRTCHRDNPNLLRGGISIALALSLPVGPVRDLLLAATIGAVLFGVLVQRMTLGRVIERGKVPHGVHDVEEGSLPKGLG